MRSLPLLAATSVILAGAWACGGDGGNTGPNTNPTASFSAPACTVGVACAFTDASTDSDGTVGAWSWNFGDGTPLDTNRNPSHTFGAAGTFQVTLTVTDNAGGTGTVTVPVTVTGGTGNQPPVANFSIPACTAGTPCGFSGSTSTDPDGTVTAWHWDFGGGDVADGSDVTHTFAAAGPASVTLTVTDNLGATGSSTQTVNVTAPTSQSCTTTGNVVDCNLGITQKVTVALTVQSRSCELTGNKLAVTVPRAQNLFFNLCSGVVGATETVKDVNGAPAVLAAGSTLSLRFTQGTADPTDPVPGDPGIRLDGTFPNWTLNIDDGGNPGAGGEPDFNDAVITVTATLAP
jgi:PKD repeat protein